MLGKITCPYGRKGIPPILNGWSRAAAGEPLFEDIAPPRIALVSALPLITSATGPSAASAHRINLPTNPGRITDCALPVQTPRRDSSRNRSQFTPATNDAGQPKHTEPACKSAAMQMAWWKINLADCETAKGMISALAV